MNTLHRIMHMATQSSQGSTAFEELDLKLVVSTPDFESPRWPSGVRLWDDLSGGAYGFTAISGKKKLGKSIIAVRSSVEAARQGWFTHYCYGENTPGLIASMVARTLGPIPASEPPEWFVERWRGMRFRRGHSIEAVMKNVADYTPRDAERILIVLDSINRLARYCPGGEYLRNLSYICHVAQTMCEDSAGKIGFLVLSETNQRGGMIGLDVEHAAGCLVYLRRTRDPAKVKFTIESRESPSGELGELTRDWENCKFDTPELVTAKTDTDDGDNVLPLFPRRGEL